MALYYLFGRHAHYVGDDLTILNALYGEGISRYFHQAVRPLEYLAGWLSMQSGLPVWHWVAMAAGVLTPLATLALANLVTGDRSASWWKLVLCVATPLAAMPYFQVDTVSQALANLFAVLLVIVTLQLLRHGATTLPAAGGWRWCALACLCLASKETSYGLIVASGALLFWRFRRAVLPPLLLVALLLLTSLVWSKQNTFDISEGAHYALKTNPAYWLFTVLFSWTVMFSAVPTAPLLTGGYAASGLAQWLIVIGALLTLAALAALCLALRPHLAALRRKLWRERFGEAGAFVFLCGAALVPAMFFKASELYASQALPFLKTLLIGAVLLTGGRALRAALLVLCAGWLLASIANITFYALSTGQTLGTSSWRRGLEPAVDQQTRVYSVYSTRDLYPNYRVGACEFVPWNGIICLPPDIAGAFPRPVTPP